jgi:hypothetical protein
MVTTRPAVEFPSTRPEQATRCRIAHEEDVARGGGDDARSAALDRAPLSSEPVGRETQAKRTSCSE